MKRRLSAVLLLSFVVVSAPGALAQQKQTVAFSVGVPAPQLQISMDPQEESQSPQDAMSMSGMFLGAVAMIGGAAVASGLKQGACENSDDDGCMSHHAFTGALIGGTAFVPIGVHIANRNKKSLITSLAVSTLAGALFYFGTKAIPGEPVELAPFLAAPVQMVTSIKIETRK